MNNLIKESLIKLKQKNITSPELDLRILLKHASKKNDEIILSNLNVDNIDIVKFKSYLQKRINRQPIAKIIKNKPFWKNNFYVNNFFSFKIIFFKKIGNAIFIVNYTFHFLC